MFLLSGFLLASGELHGMRSSLSFAIEQRQAGSVSRFGVKGLFSALGNSFPLLKQAGRQVLCAMGEMH